MPHSLIYTSPNLPMGTLLLYFKGFLLAFFVASFSLLHLVHAQTQQGFISIDCGSNSSSTEPLTGINYVSDSNYVETGIAKSIPQNSISNTLLKQLWNLRTFPDGIRNCYNIKVKLGTKYLIRASFLYANYDGKNSIPEFDLYFGPDFWITVDLGDDIQNINNEEIIHITTSNRLQICLINNGNGIPFISSLELRPLANTSYVTSTGSLSNFLRLDIGAPNDTFIRFPDDIYDRIWSPPVPIIKWTPISTSLDINNQDAPGFIVPSKVLSTASTVINASAPMEFSWSDSDSSNQYYVYMYFAELQILTANQSRSFKIFLNDKPWIADDIEILYLTENVARSLTPLTTSTTYDFKLVMSGGSTLPPILNAIEIYKVMDFEQITTDQRDVDAIESIKNDYGIAKNWQGDPCAPKTFAWGGLNCSYDSSNPSIIGLDLSSSGLIGEISTNISNLANLVALDLSNNSLSGSVPDFLAGMPLLTILNLSGNNLSGQIPAALVDKLNKGSLSLSVEGNPDLEGITTSGKKKKKNNVVVPIVAAVGGVIVVLALVLVSVYFIRRKRSSKGPIIEPRSPINSQLELFNPHEQLQTPSRQFSYSDILKYTKNFGRLLGEGGFGKVYYGLMDNDTEVAVKMLSPKSAQGYREFQAEVDLLLRVHHRNLTSLVGYCNEGETKMGLIYEYMGKGNLGSILSDGGEVLRWEDRLQIALDSAQGLEYLHSGCRPPIVHRDIKTTNILLNGQLQAKLADFGLSRAFPTEGGATHVTTKVVGTPGYLDPDYYTSYKLTEKSDVYSFGIVILELITGRPVLVRTSEQSHIIQWVDSNINQGDIYSIIDPRIKEDCNTNSVWKAVDIGMCCTAVNPINRPTMSQVVSELKECLKLEFNQRGHQIDSATSISSTYHSEFGPVAR